ncbi:hypothetical protein [Grimontia sp. NTOU-MAR1]|uniref:hypothetical protein n=1 Tax=Grimontia sp. NTOU-MAR1 TaxID=3111011 RepID=UPI002DBFCC6B|nr:hypothetical protein [Grimontia sp. NTOU-MAR1]WRV96230.1 hypothetical protein VP504_00100 [Grimontia sp. NTOU-MAR1]
MATSTSPSRWAQGLLSAATLIVTDQDGNELFNGTVTQAMLDNGVPVTMTAPSPAPPYTVTATVTDPASNTATSSDSATFGIMAAIAPTAPTVVITEDADNDGYINEAELNNDIDISVTLGSGTKVGDTIEVTDQDGNVILRHGHAGHAG